jgi:hypothetical protein
MNKIVTVCDLCQKDQSDRTVLELRACYEEVHICTDCFGKPIGALAELTTGIERRRRDQECEGKMAMTEGPIRASRGTGRLGLAGLNSRDAEPTPR